MPEIVNSVEAAIPGVRSGNAVTVLAYLGAGAVIAFGVICLLDQWPNPRLWVGQKIVNFRTRNAANVSGIDQAR
jgi:hypothetical protein